MFQGRKVPPKDSEWAKVIEDIRFDLKSNLARGVTLPTLQRENPGRLMSCISVWQDPSAKEAVKDLHCKILVKHCKNNNTAEVGEAFVQRAGGFDRNFNWIVLKWTEVLVARGIKHPSGQWEIRDFSLETLDPADTVVSFVLKLTTSYQGLFYDILKFAREAISDPQIERLKRAIKVEEKIRKAGRQLVYRNRHLSQGDVDTLKPRNWARLLRL